LLRALGTKNDARYNLKIVDNGPPRDYQQSSAPAKSDDDASEDSASDEKVDSSSDTAEETSTSSDDSSDVVSKTRKELAELDDLEL
jgi:hypothetical protein